MTSRAEFLDRIRGEMRKTRGLFPAGASARPERPADAVEIVRRQLAERWPETLERFRREFEGVGGVFHTARAARDVPGVVASIARDRGLSRLVAWHPSALGADFSDGFVREGLRVEVMPADEVADVERQRLRAAAADADLGVTGVDLAVAETGTLVLRSGAGRPRSTSLLPPCHLAVFDRRVLIETLQQLGVFFEAWHAAPAGSSGAMINLITGPSRTADIELTLTRGVHGPKEVHAVFVETALDG